MSDPDDGSFVPNHVYQAQGMVSIQAACSLDEAWDRLHRVARATGESIDLIAQQVLDRRLRFEPTR